MYRDADRDPELKGWFKQMDAYIRKCLQRQGFVMEDAASEEWNQLQDKGNFLFKDRYKDHTNHVLDEFKFFGQQFDEDAQNKRFAASMQKLFTDLGNDENGKPTFKPHLLKDLSTVVIPGVFESIRYVPVPRIEYTDHMVDAIVENLIIESDNLAPNLAEYEMDNHFKWGRRTASSSMKHKVMVSISGVQMDLKDVSYYIHKKTGFPSLKDTGVMDIFMGGSGFSFKIAMETADKNDRQHFFKINTVHVDIKSFTIKLKQSKHKLLFNMFRPLMFAIIRPAVGKVMEKLIKDQVHAADAKAYEIYQEAQRAAQAAANDPDQAQNIYSRYVNAAQKTLTQKQQKAQEMAADKKANVAMTQLDSIFPRSSYQAAFRARLQNTSNSLPRATNGSHLSLVLAQHRRLATFRVHLASHESHTARRHLVSEALKTLSRASLLSIRSSQGTSQGTINMVLPTAPPHSAAK